MSYIVADSNDWTPAPQPLGMNFGVCTPNVWNVASATGQSIMTLIAGVLSTDVNITPQGTLSSSLIPTAFEYPVPILAYSEVIYGANNYGTVLGIMSSQLQFPMLVSEFVNLNLSVHENTYLQTQDYYVDLLYDIWLKSDNTLRPVNSGDFEIMVLPLLRNSPYLGAPIAIYITLTTKIYGLQLPVIWGVFLLKNPISNWTMIIWQPLFEQWLSLPNPNDISIPLSELILASQSLTNINLLNYYIMGIEFGSEFGLGTTASYNYNWTLSNYYFEGNFGKVQLL